MITQQVLSYHLILLPGSTERDGGRDNLSVREVISVYNSNWAEGSLVKRKLHLSSWSNNINYIFPVFYIITNPDTYLYKMVVGKEKHQI